MTREIFQLLFSTAVQNLGWNDLEVARHCEISRPTVGRWLNGEAAVHPVGREPIIRALMNRMTGNHLSFCELMLEHGVSTGCPECDYEVKTGEVGPYDYHTCEEDRSSSQ